WTLNERGADDVMLQVTLTDLAGRELAPAVERRVVLVPDSSQRQLDLEMAVPTGFDGVVMLGIALDGQRNSYLFGNSQEFHLRDALSAPEVLANMFTAQA
ncbi:MAG TPA: hypothetical protein VM536_00325, partial [Chloroflexia bacterium]|nr:hypothetical protein [Chloroflexia bacterium]